MSSDGNWPHFEITFDKEGDIDPAAKRALVEAVRTAGLTDVLVFSHGWNNSQDGARSLYKRWFEIQQPLAKSESGKVVGTIGVIWPAMRWPDEPIADVAAADGGAASLASDDASGSDGDPIRALRAVYPRSEQQQILDQLADLFDHPPQDDTGVDEGLASIKALMNQLAATEPHDEADEDNGETAMLEEEPRSLAMRFAAVVEAPAVAPVDTDEGGAADLGSSAVTLAPIDDEEGAAGLNISPKRLWKGAKEALRQFTYWQMKGRAGTVGEKGLGPFLVELANDTAAPRVHLIGHSFGARLVSFALKALPDDKSPVHSLTLLEGAFSHSSFAPKLPTDPSRHGALAGQEKKVAGPITVVYSSFDIAVGTFYPLASMAFGQDASDLPIAQQRWGAMGHDGAQGVPTNKLTLQEGMVDFVAVTTGFLNVDAAAVVKTGKSPSGAHSDIFHAELAALQLTASRLR